MTNKGFENWKLVKTMIAKDCMHRKIHRKIYEVMNHIVTVDKDDSVPGGLDIHVKSINDGRYIPEIHVGAGFKDDYQNVYITTKFYGVIGVDEISNVIEAYKEAQEVAKEIMRAYPQCFENKEVAR